jgi:hypothetical protein
LGLGYAPRLAYLARHAAALRGHTILIRPLAQADSTTFDPRSVFAARIFFVKI